MQIKVSFLGAAQNVTGSAYLLEANGSRLLVDCGLYQERHFRRRNWAPFPVPPETLDAVLLTHAHLDHCGLLPKLVQEGLMGKVYCTTATSELSRILLMDSAHLHEHEAESRQERHECDGRGESYPEVPLYTTGHVRDCFPLFVPVRYEEPIEVGDGIAARFYDAGHVLGSSMIKFEIKRGGEHKILLFSGDVGRWDRPILRDPTLFNEADYVLVESTYGNRPHEKQKSTEEMLADVINFAWKAGGNIVIPSFALERSQEILYCLNKLLIEGRIPHLMIFLDSPMATDVTEVFKHHLDLLDEETLELLRQGKSPFDFHDLRIVRTIEESRVIDHTGKTAIIIAGSGMCTGGRITYHLMSNISRAESTILFVGYQATGTLGREIVEGAKQVRILGRTYAVSAKIIQMDGLSGHADRDELLRWLSGLQTPLSHLFITHGEPDVSQYFANFLRKRTSWEISVPQYRDKVILD
jgi:metallo-beta-lactamase family protein